MSSSMWQSRSQRGGRTHVPEGDRWQQTDPAQMRQGDPTPQAQAMPGCPPGLLGDLSVARGVPPAGPLETGGRLIQNFTQSGRSVLQWDGPFEEFKIVLPEDGGFRVQLPGNITREYKTLSDICQFDEESGKLTNHTKFKGMDDDPGDLTFSAFTSQVLMAMLKKHRATICQETGALTPGIHPCHVVGINHTLKNMPKNALQPFFRTASVPTSGPTAGLVIGWPIHCVAPGPKEAGNSTSTFCGSGLWIGVTQEHCQHDGRELIVRPFTNDDGTCIPHIHYVSELCIAHGQRRCPLCPTPQHPMTSNGMGESLHGLAVYQEACRLAAAERSEVVPNQVQNRISRLAAQRHPAAMQNGNFDDVANLPQVYALNARGKRIATRGQGDIMTEFKHTAKKGRAAASCVEDPQLEAVILRVRLAAELEAAAREGLHLRHGTPKNRQLQDLAQPLTIQTTPLEVSIIPPAGRIAYKYLCDVDPIHQTPLCLDMFMGTVNVPYIKTLKEGKMRPLQIPVFSMSFKSPVSLGANRSGQGTEARGIPVSQFAVESPGAQPLEKHLRMVVNATQMDFSLDEPSKPSLTMHDCSLVEGNAVQKTFNGVSLKGHVILTKERLRTWNISRMVACSITASIVKKDLGTLSRWCRYHVIMLPDHSLASVTFKPLVEPARQCMRSFAKGVLYNRKDLPCCRLTPDPPVTRICASALFYGIHTYPLLELVVLNVSRLCKMKTFVAGAVAVEGFATVFLTTEGDEEMMKIKITVAGREWMTLSYSLGDKIWSVTDEEPETRKGLEELTESVNKVTILKMEAVTAAAAAASPNSEAIVEPPTQEGPDMTDEDSEQQLPATGDVAASARASSNELGVRVDSAAALELSPADEDELSEVMKGGEKYIKELEGKSGYLSFQAAGVAADLSNKSSPRTAMLSGNEDKGCEFAASMSQTCTQTLASGGASSSHNVGEVKETARTGGNEEPPDASKKQEGKRVSTGAYGEDGGALSPPVGESGGGVLGVSSTQPPTTQPPPIAAASDPPARREIPNPLYFEAKKANAQGEAVLPFHNWIAGALENAVLFSPIFSEVFPALRTTSNTNMVAEAQVCYEKHAGVHEKLPVDLPTYVHKTPQMLTDNIQQGLLRWSQTCGDKVSNRTIATMTQRQSREVTACTQRVNNLKAELEKAERTQARLQQRKLELQGQSAPDDEAVEDARKHAEEQAKLEERRQPSEAAYRSKGSAFLPAKRNAEDTIDWRDTRCSTCLEHYDGTRDPTFAYDQVGKKFQTCPRKLCAMHCKAMALIDGQPRKCRLKSHEIKQAESGI